MLTHHKDTMEGVLSREAEIIYINHNGYFALRKSINHTYCVRSGVGFG